MRIRGPPRDARVIRRLRERHRHLPLHLLLAAAALGLGQLVLASGCRGGVGLGDVGEVEVELGGGCLWGLCTGFDYGGGCWCGCWCWDLGGVSWCGEEGRGGGVWKADGEQGVRTVWVKGVERVVGRRERRSSASVVLMASVCLVAPLFVLWETGLRLRLALTLPAVEVEGTDRRGWEIRVDMPMGKPARAFSF